MTDLISCVMVTGNRPRFLRQAISLYDRQTWPAKELVLVVNGPETDLSCVPERDDIFVLPLGAHLPIGAALNIGIDVADGDFIARMDDDDWYHRDWLRAVHSRLTSAIAPETGQPADPREALSGTWRPLVYLAGSGELRHWPVPEGEWAAGAGAWSFGCTYAFHRALWQKRAYRENMERGEDTAFFHDHAFYYVPIERSDMFMYVRHGEGHLSKLPDDYYRERCPLYYRSLEAVVGPEDAGFYASLRPAVTMTT